MEEKMMDAINAGHSKNFVQIPHDLLRNPNISFEAKGIMCLLLSISDPREENKVLSKIKQIEEEKAGDTRTALKELEDNGYLKRR